MQVTLMARGAIGRTVESEAEFFDVPKTVKLSETIIEQLRQRKVATGVPISTQIRRAVESELRSEQGYEYAPVHIWGYIPAGPALEVCPLPDHTTVRPPFKLGPDCYGLLVTGDSMEAEHGASIPNGSYAFFCPNAYPAYGVIVHAEFEDEYGEHSCTLKKYAPQPDGSVRFEPLNKKYKPIIKHEGEYLIKGCFVRAWSG